MQCWNSADKANYIPYILFKFAAFTSLEFHSSPRSFFFEGLVFAICRPCCDSYVKVLHTAKHSHLYTWSVCSLQVREAITLVDITLLVEVKWTVTGRAGVECNGGSPRTKNLTRLCARPPVFPLCAQLTGLTQSDSIMFSTDVATCVFALSKRAGL